MPAEAILEREPLSDSFDRDDLYEVVGGQVVEVAPMSAFAGTVASFLVSLLNQHAVPRKLGWAVSEVLFNLGPGRNERRPDVAFITQGSLTKPENGQRWPRAYKTVPALAVEVVSPSNTAEEIEKRMLEFFEAGVSQVWVIYPMFQRIYFYDSATSVRILTRNDTLDVGAILPGLQINLSDFFDALPQI